MLKFILRLIIYALAVMLSAYILPGVGLDNFWSAVIVAGVLTLFNATLKPLLIILTIPITVLTLGLFLLVINTLLILLTDSLISGFSVDGFWWALLFSLVLSIINSIFLGISGENQK